MAKTGNRPPKQIKVVKAEVFELDPSKKYLVLLKSSRIPRDVINQISARLRREFGDVFTLGVPADTTMEIIEAGDSEPWEAFDVNKHNKMFYDVKLEDGAIALHCWPDTDRFHTDSGSVLPFDKVVRVRRSKLQEKIEGGAS